jgi:nucleolar protein 53
VEAHQELLQKAHEEEEKRVREENRFKEVKERMENARVADDIDERGGRHEGLPSGMTVQPIEEEEEQGENEAIDEVPIRKVSGRKTKAQRAKAAKLLAEVCSFHALLLIPNCLFSPKFRNAPSSHNLNPSASTPPSPK